jgi:hypothetical protein
MHVFWPHGKLCFWCYFKVRFLNVSTVSGLQTKEPDNKSGKCSIWNYINSTKIYFSRIHQLLSFFGGSYQAIESMLCPVFADMFQPWNHQTWPYPHSPRVPPLSSTWVKHTISGAWWGNPTIWPPPVIDGKVAIGITRQIMVLGVGSDAQTSNVQIMWRSWPKMGCSEKSEGTCLVYPEVLDLSNSFGWFKNVPLWSPMHVFYMPGFQNSQGLTAQSQSMQL